MLFRSLWLMNSSEQVKKAVAGYFQDPSGKAQQLGSAEAGSGETLAIKKDEMSLLSEKLAQAMKEIPEFQSMKEQVQITVTAEGLRVELLETESGMFFETGSAKPSPGGQALLELMAREIGKLPNQIQIEGHTDSRPFAGGGPYGNWELSVDRANAARRLMQSTGLRGDQVTQVRGFADRSLRNPQDPNHASNRRISVLVRYRTAAPEAEPATGAPGTAAPAEKKGGH